MTDQTPSAETAKRRNNSRRKAFLILGLAVAGVALVYGLYWFFIGSHYVSTDDAYVDASIAQVTPAVSGIVQSILVNDTQRVQQGDVLVKLDQTDATLALTRANATLATAQANLQRAQLDLERRQKLASSGAVSAEELTNARSQVATGEADVEAAKAAQSQAMVDLSRTTVVAPISGIVAKRTIQLGQHVAAGTPMMAVVPLGKVYVNANFKEVQLEHVHPGQPVTLESDLYGGDVTFHGTVVGLSGGTGSAFATIPAQNATGNWIKVVQRLPVRIRLNPDELKAHPLQVGLSMKATIDISR